MYTIYSHYFIQLKLDKKTLEDQLAAETMEYSNLSNELEKIRLENAKLTASVCHCITGNGKEMLYFECI